MKLKIVNYSVLTILLIIFTQTVIFAQSNPTFSKVEFSNETLSENGKSSFETLLKTDTFTLNGFGVAAQPHFATKALVNLIKEKQSEKALQYLVRNATPEGQIYGLLGLQVIKSKHFKSDLEVFKTLVITNIEINSSGGGCSPENISLKKKDVINALETGSLAQRFNYLFNVKP